MIFDLDFGMLVHLDLCSSGLKVKVKVSAGVMDLIETCKWSSENQWRHW